ncbi:aromatic motif membrane protein [Mycoplasma sp. OR1901]|uniref:aromatic motif membrane protein n=1 Tax=Mycoplasma sp. OR1901 TaxID=2742195 RepID=UPI001582132E|nr:aromatic motif membrane protein [Mycoplasma sp. OR1901]QKT05129.1 hypothetical protein HTZ87_00135 [Mycoplasma sp. OR1901]
MKKSLKYSLLSLTTLTAIIVTSLSVGLSVNNASIKPKDNNYKNHLQTKKEENVYLKQLADEFFFNSELTDNFKNDYFNNQNNINDNYFNELNVALTYAPFPVVHLLEIAKDIKIKYARQSVEIFENLLTNNWYWYLTNLDSFLYQFNPFNSKYKDNKDDKGKDTKEIQKEFEELFNKNELFYKIKNTDITGYKTFEIPNLKQDVYTNKKIGFLKVSNNVLIPFFTYTNEKKENIIMITPDLFVFNKEIEDTTIKNIADLFISLRQERIDSDIAYFKKISSSGQYDENEVYKTYDDKTLFQIFNKNNYSELFFKELFRFNQLDNDIKFKRFTWGFNEKK